MEDGTWRLWSNERLKETITTKDRKRRTISYGNLKKMDDSNLTKRIIIYLNGIKTVTGWFKRLERDLEEMGIEKNAIKVRDTFRKAIDNFKGFKSRKTDLKKSDYKWPEERRR